MAASREAKIQFKADTESFNDSIKSAKEEIKTLNSDLKLNAAEMRNAGESVELLEQRHELLNQKLAANAQEQEALTQKIEVAKEIFGENSEEVGKLERQLTGVQTAEQYIESDIKNVNDRLEDQQTAAEQAESALGKLTAEIENQQTELENMREEYVNTVLEWGTDSDEAQSLAEQISALSTELENNEQRLSDAKAAAENLGGEFSNAGSEASGAAGSVQGLSGEVNPLSGALSSIGDIAPGALGSIGSAILEGGVIGAVSSLTGLLGDACSGILNMANEWKENVATIAEGTGLLGEELEEATRGAMEANLAVKDAEQGSADASAIWAELNTRLAMTGETANATTSTFMEFAKITGTNGVTAVDLFSDVLQRWGLSAEQLPMLMDQVTVANQSCDLSVGGLMTSLVNNAEVFQILGYNTDSALGSMVAWEQAGINSTQVVQGLQRGMNNLIGEVDDVPGTMQMALQAVSEYNTIEDGLNVTVGNTGKTIQDVFGKRNAVAIVSAMQSGRVETARYTQAVRESSSAMQNTYENSITLKDEFSNLGDTVSMGVRDAFDVANATMAVNSDAIANAYGLYSDLSMSSEDLSSSLTALGYSTEEAGSSTETLGQQTETAATEIKTGYSDMGTAAENAKTKMNNAANNTDLSNIKTEVSGVKSSWDTARSSMENTSWSLPAPSIPKFYWTGDLDAKTKSVPELNVTWHAEGGIFNRPTLLPALHGVGEAGAEAIAPISTLQDYVADAVIDNTVQIDYDLLSEKIAVACSRLNIAIQLDDREFGRVVRGVM